MRAPAAARSISGCAPREASSSSKAVTVRPSADTWPTWRRPWYW